MRIAVASKGLDVAPRFEFAESYTCYTVDRGIIADCQNVPAPRASFTEIAELLLKLDVSAIIVGAIPIDIANVFCRASIEVVAGASGSAREVVEQYLTRTLIGVDEMCHWEDDELDQDTLAKLGCAL